MHLTNIHLQLGEPPKNETLQQHFITWNLLHHKKHRKQRLSTWTILNGGEKKRSGPQRRTSEVNEPVHVASEANVLAVPPVPVRVQTRNKMALRKGANGGGENQVAKNKHQAICNIHPDQL